MSKGGFIAGGCRVCGQRGNAAIAAPGVRAAALASADGGEAAEGGAPGSARGHLPLVGVPASPGTAQRRLPAFVLLLQP